MGLSVVFHDRRWRWRLSRSSSCRCMEHLFITSRALTCRAFSIVLCDLSHSDGVGESIGSPRSCLKAIIQVHGQRLQILQVRTRSPRSERMSQGKSKAKWGLRKKRIWWQIAPSNMLMSHSPPATAMKGPLSKRVALGVLAPFLLLAAPLVAQDTPSWTGRDASCHGANTGSSGQFRRAAKSGAKSCRQPHQRSRSGQLQRRDHSRRHYAKCAEHSTSDPSEA